MFYLLFLPYSVVRRFAEEAIGASGAGNVESYESGFLFLGVVLRRF